MRDAGSAGAASAHDRVRQGEGLAHFDVRDSARRPLIHDLFDLARTELRRHQISAPVRVAWKLHAGGFGTGEPDEAAHAHGVRGRLIGRGLGQRLGIPRTLDRLLELLESPGCGAHLFLDFNCRGQLGPKVVHLFVAVADDAQTGPKLFEVLLLDGHNRSKKENKVRSKKLLEVRSLPLISTSLLTSYF